MWDTAIDEEQIEADSEWFVANYDSLKERFAGMAIAIKNKAVILTGKDYREFLEKLKKMDIDPSEILVEVIPDAGIAYIL